MLLGPPINIEKLLENGYAYYCNKIFSVCGGGYHDELTMFKLFCNWTPNKHLLDQPKKTQEKIYKLLTSIKNGKN